MRDPRFELPPDAPWLVEEPDAVTTPLEDLPGWDRLKGAFRDDLYRVEIEGFMTTPQPDLEGPDGEATRPVDWLLAGGAVEAVVELARWVGFPI